MNIYLTKEKKGRGELICLQDGSRHYYKHVICHLPRDHIQSRVSHGNILIPLFMYI